MNRIKGILWGLFDQAQIFKSSLFRPKGVDRTALTIASRLAATTKAGARSAIIRSVVAGDVTIGDHTAVVDAHVSGKVKIGRYTSFNGPGSDIAAKIHPVTIGNFCSIARNCTIQEFNHITDRCTSYYIFRNLVNAESRQNFIWAGLESKDIESRGPISIGHDVWIGAQVVILSGVTIGTGAVIAANSTVTRDIPPYAIAGGTPAKVIKYRFPEEVIQKLLELRWWDWSDEKIRFHKSFFEGELNSDALDVLLS